MMVPKCDRCQSTDVQVVPVLGRDLCARCREAFDAWVVSGQDRARTGVTVDVIKRAVGDYFGVTVAEFDSATRTQAVSFPRAVAMYLCRNRIGASYPEIGRQFGGKDHTTAVSAVKKVRAMIDAEDQRVIDAVSAVYGRLSD